MGSLLYARQTYSASSRALSDGLAAQGRRVGVNGCAGATSASRASGGHNHRPNQSTQIERAHCGVALHGGRLGLSLGPWSNRGFILPIPDRYRLGRLKVATQLLAKFPHPDFGGFHVSSPYPPLFPRSSWHSLAVGGASRMHWTTIRNR